MFFFSGIYYFNCKYNRTCPCGQWFEVRGSCWFYWYWRTCWPSLLYFHSMTYMGRKWTTGIGKWLLTHCTCVRTEKLMLLLVGTMQLLFFKICVCCFWCTHIETQTQYILWSTVRHSPNTIYTVVHSQTLQTQYILWSTVRL